MRLVNEGTFVAGRRLPPRLPAPPPEWIPLTEAQRAALARREDDLRTLLATPLVGVDGLAEQFPDLVCGMNLHLMEGVRTEVGFGDGVLEPRLAPEGGRCCVRFGDVA